MADKGKRVLALLSSVLAVMILASVIAHGDAGAVRTRLGAATPPRAVISVSVSGSDSSCVRGDLARPCSSFNRAYELARCGDVVEVGAGSYPQQVLTARDKACGGSFVSFRPAAGATVSLDGVYDAAGPEWLEFNGLHVNRQLQFYGGVDNLRIINVDGGSFDLDSQNVFMSGNNWGPCDSNGAITCGGQNFLQARSANVVIDGDTFHDYRITPDSGAHFECLYVTGSAGPVTIRNSSFYNCETYGIYFTGWLDVHQYNGSITLENNTFGRTCCFSTGDRNSAINLGGSLPSVVRNLVIRNNTFISGQTVVREGGPAGSNIRIEGNILGSPECVPDATYAGNWSASGRTCSATDVTKVWGYQLVDNKLGPDGARAAAVQLAFSRVARRVPLDLVVKELKRRRLQAPGGSWTTFRLRALLEDKNYAGHLFGRRTSTSTLVPLRTWKTVQTALRTAPKKRSPPKG